ncbi:hypothetical protein Bca101_018539 [Brassica carinata]
MSHWLEYSSMSDGRTRVITSGILIRCSCGEGFIELISKSDPDSYRRYNQCLHATQSKVKKHSTLVVSVSSFLNCRYFLLFVAYERQSCLQMSQ